MKSEWGLTQIGNICKTNLSTYSVVEKWAFVNYLDTGNITENRVSEIQYIITEQDILPSRARRKVAVDDIIYSTVRPNQRHYGIIRDVLPNMLVSTGFTVITVDKEKADSDFLYYYLTQNDIVDSLHAIGEQSVSAYPSIKPPDIESIEILLPSLPEQVEIGRTLRALDDKIANNRAINNHLEQIAQAIFKSWFVDFEPFGGVMPEDWREGTLGDILQSIKQPVKAGECPKLPYVPIDTIPMNSLALTDFRPSEEAQSSLLTFAKNDILIGAMRVYFHRVSIAPFDGITRTTCFILRPSERVYLEYVLLLCNEDSTIDHAQNISKGSTMPYAVWDSGLANLPIVIPTPDVVQEFSDILRPVIEWLRDSLFEIRHLSNLRNLLLPRLMSGEIEIVGGNRNNGG